MTLYQHIECDIDHPRLFLDPVKFCKYGRNNRPGCLLEKSDRKDCKRLVS